MFSKRIHEVLEGQGRAYTTGCLEVVGKRRGGGETGGMIEKKAIKRRVGCY